MHLLLAASEQVRQKGRTLLGAQLQAVFKLAMGDQLAVWIPDFDGPVAMDFDTLVLAFRARVRSGEADALAGVCSATGPAGETELDCAQPRLGVESARRKGRQAPSLARQSVR